MVRAVERVRPRSRPQPLAATKTRTRISSTNKPFFPAHRFIRSDRISSNAKFLGCLCHEPHELQGCSENSCKKNPARAARSAPKGRCTCMRTTMVISCVHPPDYGTVFASLAAWPPATSEVACHYRFFPGRPFEVRIETPCRHNISRRTVDLVSINAPAQVDRISDITDFTVHGCNKISVPHERVLQPLARLLR